jgi:HAD superfamily hydrolase (TIGR01509 family)
MAKSTKNESAFVQDEEMVALLFSDIKGYSKLTPDLLQRFNRLVFPQLAKFLKRRNPVCINTWGDAIYAVFKSPGVAAEAAWELKEYFRRKSWSEHMSSVGTPVDFGIRIALHAAPVFFGTDPFTNRPNAFGKNVTHTARIEPIVRLNEIWATASFKTQMELQVTDYALDPIGQRDLVKDWGFAELFLLRKSEDPKLDVPPLAEPVQRLIGPKSSDEAKTIVDRIFKNAKKPGGHLTIAGVANRDLFGNTLGSAIEDVLKCKPDDGAGNPVRVLYLDPASPSAFARETYEKNPIRKDTVSTAREITGSLDKATNSRTIHENLFIRTSYEVAIYMMYNQEEMILHPYLNSAVGNAINYVHVDSHSPLYAIGARHFENLWQGRWILLDLGKVLIPFNHDKVATEIWEFLTNTEPSREWNANDFDSFLFKEKLEGGTRNELLETNDHGIEWLHDEFCTRFSCNFPFDQFRAIWNNIFSKEHPEAKTFIHKMQDRGISVAICSNTNESHWAWIEQNYANLIGMANRLFLSFRIGSRKPDPKFFREICLQTHLPPWHHVLMDDREENVEGALRAGLRAERFRGSFQMLERWTIENHWDSTYPDDLKLSRRLDRI